MKLTSNQRRILNENRGNPPTPEQYQKYLDAYKNRMSILGDSLIHDFARWVAGDHSTHIGALSNWDSASIARLVKDLGRADLFNKLVKSYAGQLQQNQMRLAPHNQVAQQFEQAYQQLLSLFNDDKLTKESIESDFYKVLDKLDEMKRTGDWR